MERESEECLCFRVVVVDDGRFPRWAAADGAGVHGGAVGAGSRLPCPRVLLHYRRTKRRA